MNKYSHALAARFDAGETAVMARELEHIEQQVTEVLYPDLYAMDFIPLIPGVDAGAEIYTWRQEDLVGEAKVIANRGEDLPTVDISLTENYVPIRSIGNSYSYTTQELRRFAEMKARGSSIQLDVERAKKAREFIERKTDAVLFGGESGVTGLTGFANNTNVNLQTPAFGSWATATAQQILADLQLAERTVFTQSKQRLMADTILLDPVSYALAAQTPLGVNNDHTCLRFFLESAMSVKTVRPWWRLSTADAGGTGPRMICYKRDLSVLGGLVPLVFQAQPPQPRGLEFVIPAEARVGGTVVKRPLGVLYMDSL
jgi:hypothetical protein